MCAVSNDSLDTFHAPSPAGADEARPSLIGIDRTGLQGMLAEMGEKPFRARQLWQWIYHRGARSFADMSDLSKDLRQRLEARYTLERPAIARQQTSTDGTRKWLLDFADGQQAEAVYIPEDDRGAVCISSQVGCTLTCKFCHTGTQLLVRNLTPGEIVGQFMVARDSYGEWPSPTDATRMLSNVVLMGMGEPLFNYDNVAQAVRIIMDDEGLSLGKRRITLSTAGVVPLIHRAGAELGINLAVSLHAHTDEVRDRLMPINKKYPLAELMAACRSYPGLSNARRITFEYILLKGINDGDDDARALGRLVAGIPCKFNLIPFNPWPGSGFEPPSGNRVMKFSNILNDMGYSAPVRQPRGQDILAACGQLRSDSQRVPRHQQPWHPEYQGPSA